MNFFADRLAAWAKTSRSVLLYKVLRTGMKNSSDRANLPAHPMLGTHKRAFPRVRPSWSLLFSSYDFTRSTLAILLCSPTVVTFSKHASVSETTARRMGIRGCARASCSYGRRSRQNCGLLPAQRSHGDAYPRG